MATIGPRRGGRHGFYHDVQLRGPVPERLLVRLPDPHGPAPAMAGRLARAAETGADAFFAPGRGFAAAHGFSWLAVLAHPGDALAPDRARHAAGALWDAWLAAHGRYAPAGWAPPLAAARTEAMLRHAPLLLEGRDAPSREAFFGTLIRQTRHLARAAKAKEASGAEGLATLAGAAIGSLCLPFASDQERVVKPVLATSLERVANGALPPEVQTAAGAMRLGTTLSALRDAYAQRGLTPPAGLAPALGLCRLLLGARVLPDGGLAVLPGGAEGDRDVIAALSPLRRPEGAALSEGRGEARAEAAPLILDVALSGALVGAASGAFALTDGEDRLVTAAGAPGAAAAGFSATLARWREALCQPAAAATLDAEGFGPADLTREESEEGTLLTLARRGSAGPHERRLFLAADGASLRGEDVHAPGATYRFPLHPAVQVRGPIEGRATLVLPSGRSWRFEVASAALTAEPGVYAGTGEVEDAKQLVVRTDREGVRWAFRRV